MFRHLTALILLAAFAAQTFKGAVIVIDYYANSASFARNCENKNKPKMHCNGKCQMMKKLKEEEKKDNQDPERRGERKVQTLSSKSFFIHLSPLPRFDRPMHNGRPLNGRPIDRAYSVFHPPALA